KRHLGRTELFGRQGGRVVSIPLPHLDLPHFVHDMGGKGVGQAEGDGSGGSKAGDQPGAHILEAEFSVEELAKILGEALELPRIKPKGADELESRSGRYTGIAPVGPESLRHFKRSSRRALRRLIPRGHYASANPRVSLVRADRRYRTWKARPLPKTNAAILYLMDVSGSMGDEQKEIVRTESFWI